MSRRLQERSSRKLYPAYCFPESPTYNAWVKLTAADVHGLREEPAFAGIRCLSVEWATQHPNNPHPGQNLYFYLNHPVKYVDLVGAVTEIDDKAGRTQLCILALDDGSGRTINLKVEARNPLRPRPGSVCIAQDCSLWGGELPADAVPTRQTLSTAVEGVCLQTGIGGCRLLLHGNLLEVGTIIKAKGTISTFWGERQLDLLQMAIVKTTDAELRAWQKHAVFKRDVLSKPWRLDPHRLKTLEAEAQKSMVDEQARVKRLHERKVRKHRIELANNDRREQKRRNLDAMFNAGSLPGSDMIVFPW